MHNNRIRPMGLWLTGGALYGTELETIDATLAKCLNGDDGGVWAPTTVIEIGGMGIKITGGFLADGGSFGGSLNVGGTLSCDGDIYCQGLQVGAEATFLSDLTCAGAANLDTLSCANAAHVYGVFTAHNNVYCEVSLTVTSSTTLNGTLTCTSSATFSGAVTMNGNVSFSKPMTPSSQGRVRKRVLTVSDTSDGQTFHVNNYDIVRVANGLMPANRNFVLGDTGVGEGDVIRFVNESTTYSITIRDTSANILAVIKNSTGVGFWADFCFIGGAWRSIGYQILFDALERTAGDRHALQPLATRGASATCSDTRAHAPAPPGPAGAGATARPAVVHLRIARARPVGRAIVVAGLRRLAAARAGALDALPWSAGTLRLRARIVRAGERREQSKGEGKGEPVTHNATP